MAIVGIVMGSDSDLQIMSEAAKILDDFEINYEILVVSAHRTPQKMFEYAKTARERGLKVIIAGAGGAAHLPGMIAAITDLPVIGVPVKSKTLDGLDSLYSIVQMPPGVPVATMAINGSANAALFAAQILGTVDPKIEARIKAYKENLKNTVDEKSEKLLQVGYKKYLNTGEM